MKSSTWMKDVLLISISLASLAGLANFLLPADRIKTPDGFDSAKLKQFQSTSNRVDAAFTQQQFELGIEPAGIANNLAVARRLSLSLAGTIPSVEEIRAMEAIDSGKQIDWYVSRLLEDKRTHSFLAERLARQFVGVEEGPFLVFRRRRFASWMAEQIELHRPYDEIVAQLLLDSGLWTDAPAVNFYTYNIIPGENETKPDPIRLAARTSRAFLGMRIDCLQCHDDFLGTMNLGSVESPEGGTQLHFHELAAFFSQVENSLMGIRDETGSDTYRYKLLDDEEESEIKPRVPFNEHLAGNETNLRFRLANWVTHPENRPFARAFVNRVWAIMFGIGMIQPVDDIPLEGPFPKAMEVLTDDFVENGFDIQRLIRVIALTDAFQRDSAVEVSNSIDQTTANAWASFPLTRLRPDQAAGAIIQSTSLKTIDSTSHILEQLIKFGQQIDFVQRYGDSGEDEFQERGETVTQRLLMLNGDMVSERLTDEIYSPARISRLSPNPATTVETVYLAALSRRPSEEESDYFVPQFVDKNDFEQRQKIQDLYWTLINSIEFSWNH